MAIYAEENELEGGDVVDRAGKVLGRHGGIHGVTIGQRRGLGISAAEPLYVVDIDDASKRVVVGKKNELARSGLIARSVNWLEAPDAEEFEAEVQIRYRAPAIRCYSTGSRMINRAKCASKKPFPAVTPGQAAVFYRGEQLLGGGWIERAITLRSTRLQSEITMQLFRSGICNLIGILTKHYANRNYHTRLQNQPI